MQTYLDLLKHTLTGWAYPESAYEYISGSKNPFKQAVLRALRKRGIRLVRARNFDADARLNGRDWPSIAYTMVGLKRLSNIEYCVRVVVEEDIPGDLCETGVWRGGCCIFMLASLINFGDSSRAIWACDSFEGLPKPDASTYPADLGYDLSQNDYLSVPLEAVKANIERFSLPSDRVKFVKGWFKDSLPSAPIGQLSMLRLDGDLYESTMDAITALYDKVSRGGFIIVDDYGAWEPCKKAITDFRRSRGITDEIVDIDGVGAFWRKS